VKKINRKQSRKNIKNRKARVTARHGKAGSWETQSRPMFGSGKIHFEVGSNMDAMSFGGIAPVHRLLTKLGLPSAIDSKLDLLKVHLPYHESDHVLNMSYNEALAEPRGSASASSVCIAGLPVLLAVLPSAPCRICIYPVLPKSEDPEQQPADLLCP